METILVTGATGCLGASLTKKLVEAGKKVHILAFPNTWHPFLDDLDIDIFYGDIRKQEDVMKAMKGCTHVYQVAGIVSYDYIRRHTIYSTHVDGVRTVLQAAKDLDVEKVVVTASTAGIGIPKDKNQPLDETATFDFRRYKKVAYMHSKYLTINLCKEFAEDGLNVTIVSPTTIYGQGDLTMHIGKTIKRIKEGSLTKAPPGGNAVVSVDDAVDAHLLAMEKGGSGENYIVADECISYFDMFNRVADLLGQPKITRTTAAWTLPFHKTYLSFLERILAPFGKRPKTAPHARYCSFKHRYFNSNKARKELGWMPKVHFEESIEKALAFYKKEGLM